MELGRPNRTQDDIIKRDLNKVWYMNVNLNHPSDDRIQRDALVNTVINPEGS
jgi:hypothetical protein